MFGAFSVCVGVDTGDCGVDLLCDNFEDQGFKGIGVGTEAWIGSTRKDVSKRRGRVKVRRYFCSGVRC